MRLNPLTRFLVVLPVVLLVSPAFAFAADGVLRQDSNGPAFDRISWSAVLAGAVVALAVHLALSTLGVSLGAAAVDPYNREHPIKGVPTGMLIWMFVSGLVSLFIGGWVSGRLAGTVPFDSAIHGVITWSLAMVVMFVLATTSLGHLFGGVFRVLGAGASTAATAAAAVAPEAAKMAKEAIAENVPHLNWAGIEAEAKQIFQTAGEKEVTAAKDVGVLLGKAYGAVRDGLENADRDTLAAAIVEKTGGSKDDANKTLDKWEKMYRDARQKYQQVMATAEQTARQTADMAKTAISRIALWAFASLVVGVVVAAVGGNLGSTYFRT